LKFDFVDVTNLSSPTAYHTRQLEIVFQDEDHVQLRFNGLKEGKEVPAIMSLKRQRSPIGEKGVSKDYEAAFARLKTLVGTWDVEGGNSERVDYYLTGKDSALVERFGGGRGMATVYHMDGDDIMLTHYCSAKNQPRMRSSRYDAENGILKFDFVDVTNLSKPTAYHTRELEIVFQDEDHIQLKFNGLHEGEEVPVTQSLTRRR
jgi:hypothetical protein